MSTIIPGHSAVNMDDDAAHGRKRQLISYRVVSSERGLVMYLDEKYGVGNYDISLQHNCYHILFPESRDPLSDQDIARLRGGRSR